MKLRAPAKLNLGLRVTAVREDGLHELDSLFVPLDLADELSVEVEEGAGAEVVLHAEQAPGVPGRMPSDARNLAARAAAGFLAAARCDARVSIRLRKHVPSPGGLGGGSSDAGAVLRALAERLPGAVEAAALRRLARSLGADVPFFLGPDGRGPVPARVTGIGERLAPAAGVPELHVALVHPGSELETPRVYAEFDAHEGSLTGLGARTTMPPPPGRAGARTGPDPWRSEEWLAGRLTNDLEPAARRLAPVIGDVREALSASGARAVGMSGSGPTVFGIFADASAASAALSGAPLRAVLAGRPAWTGTARTQGSGEADSTD